jgi:hypothetical protein
VVIPVAYQIIDNVLAKFGLNKKGHDYAAELEEGEMATEEKEVKELVHA